MPDDLPEFIDPVEDCPWRTPRKILARFGYTPIPPAELSDAQVPGRLWELLYAAATRRFFFCFTNHLSDRTFYQVLWDNWLDEPTADIPLEAETNTTMFVSECNAGGMTHEEIWLRYYADDIDRELANTGKTDDKLPSPVVFPYDRDRFLPTPYVPLEAHSDWLPGDDEDEEDDGEPDPLGLKDVDREIAAAKNESTSEEAPVEPVPSALEAQLAASEPENWTPPAQQLADKNIPLLPPAEITDELLTPVLWELIHNLSLCGFYLLHTDHVSDRELYAQLWERGLRDPAHLPGRNLRGGWYHDLLGSWGDDDMQLWLRFYATGEERAKHAKEYPKDTMPPREKPCANRDWRLPKGPFG